MTKSALRKVLKEGLTFKVLMLAILLPSFFAQASEPREELLGSWRLLQQKCLNSGRKVELDERSERYVFSSNGIAVLKALTRSPSSSLVMEGPYEIKQNKIIIAFGLYEEDDPSPKAKVRIKHDMMFRIQSDHLFLTPPYEQTPSTCPGGGLIESEYIRDLTS